MKSADGQVTALTPKLNHLGVTLIVQLHMVLRTIKIHDPSNKAMLIGTEHLKDTINSLWASLDGKVRLQFVGSHAFLNGLNVRVGPAVLKQSEALRQELQEKKLGGLAFKKPVDTDSLMHFIVRLARPVETEADLDALKKSLLELKDLALDLLAEKEIEDDDQIPKVDRKTYAIQSYAKTVIAAREFANALRENRSPQGSRLRIVRIVQDLIDIATERVNFLVKLAAMKHANELAYNHAANTCILSIVLGKALGIERVALVDLGTSALLADLTAALVDGASESDTWPASDAERIQFHDAVVRQISCILGNEKIYAAMVRRILIGYERHTPYRDERGEIARTQLYARIIAVTADFDRMTTSLPGRDGYTPDEAVRLLVSAAGTRYDPLVVKTFANLLGLYPVGTVVRLASRELAVVYHNHPDPERFERPWVKVVVGADRKRLTRPMVRDLSKTPGPGGVIETSMKEQALDGHDPGMVIVM